MRKRQIMVLVNDRMQRGYSYTLTASEGRDFDPRFKPELTPGQMLRLGVFGGLYITDCRREFPAAWWRGAKLSKTGRHEASLNYFKVNASQPLAEWRRKRWLSPEDPRGWFQWYCRYYRGRRLPAEDERQIKRWLGLRRHLAQLKKGCSPGAGACRPRQRQALLHWAYDTRLI